MEGKNRFFVWLSKRTAREERSRIYVALSDLNSYCLRKGVLTEPLFDTYNLEIVLKIRNMIGFDNNFRNAYRAKASAMASAIQYYLYYLQDRRRKEETAQISEEARDSAEGSVLTEESMKKTTLVEEAVQDIVSAEESAQETTPVEEDIAPTEEPAQETIPVEEPVQEMMLSN